MQKIIESVDFLKSKGIIDPYVGIILGTGLGKLIHDVAIDVRIPYADIPHFPISTVDFHHGELVFGTYKGKKVLILHGRFHTYEGYSTQEITLPIRVMKFLGIKYLLVSNAGGAMNLDFKRGEIMLIEDHINMLPNPLIGPNNDELGPRFPDMSSPYSKLLNDRIIEIAARLNVRLNRGIYLAVTGPSLETRAEYRFLRRIGADVVGMSTIPEVIVSNHMGLPVAAISVITDECDPDCLQEVKIEEILYYAARAEKGLTRIFEELIAGL
jgi:purine-nucleoside phosphorylase